MFDDIGGKIKALAKIVCWIDIVANVILAIVMFSAAEDSYEGKLFVGLGLAFLLIGPLISWILSFVLYGYGQLIENSDTIVSQNNKLLNPKFHNNSGTMISNLNDSILNQSSQAKGPISNAIQENDYSAKGVKNTVDNNQMTCPKCGFIQPSNRKCCWKCGENFINN